MLSAIKMSSTITFFKKQQRPLSVTTCIFCKPQYSNKYKFFFVKYDKLNESTTGFRFQEIW